LEERPLGGLCCCCCHQRLLVQFSLINAHRSWSRHRPPIFRYFCEKPSFENPNRATSLIDAVFWGWMLASILCSFSSLKANRIISLTASVAKPRPVESANKPYPR